MTTCFICKSRQIKSPWEESIGMCTECADTFGVMPMLPARRPARPCERCSGMQFIRAVPRELTVRVGKDVTDQVSSPMAVTFGNGFVDGFFAREAAPVDSRKAFGHLEQYICKKCGYLEWYCNDPERIPIGPAYMTESIDYAASDTPYRG